jgi:hypothetical protein
MKKRDEKQRTEETWENAQQWNRTHIEHKRLRDEQERTRHRGLDALIEEKKGKRGAFWKKIGSLYELLMITLNREDQDS